MSVRKFCKGIKCALKNAKKESVNELLNKSKITIISNNEITIEGDLNIKTYDDSDIQVETNNILIGITGLSLYLCYIKPRTLRITGKIKNITFE